MSKKNIILRKIEKAIDELDNVINTQLISIKSFSSFEQLTSFKKTLLLVKDKIENGHIPIKNERNLGIAKVVIDQWPYDFSLGLLLIDVETTYKEI